MPKEKTLFVESGKWHSKENQRVKHPRQPKTRFNDLTCRRDRKQRSIKSFYKKAVAVLPSTNKENQSNALTVQKSPKFSFVDEKQTETSNSPLQNIGNHNTTTSTVAISKCCDRLLCSTTTSVPCEEPYKATVHCDPVNNMRKPSLKVYSAEENVAGLPTSTPIFSRGIEYDFLENFSPVQTSTQISETNLCTGTGTETSLNSSSLIELDSEKSSDVISSSKHTIFGNAPLIRTRSSCAAQPEYPYNLSMRFTQDSQGNPIFCRLSQNE